MGSSTRASARWSTAAVGVTSVPKSPRRQPPQAAERPDAVGFALRLRDGRAPVDVQAEIDRAHLVRAIVDLDGQRDATDACLTPL